MLSVSLGGSSTPRSSAALRHSYAAARPSGSPREDTSVTLDGGRRLQVAEFGPPDGVAVLFVHGQPGSRLFCPDLDATIRAGVRLITFDRAGYGRSDPRPGPPTYAASVDDTIGLLDRLGVERAPVVGFSGGGPHALACGALAPDRFPIVTTVCSTSGPEAGRSSDPDVLALESLVLADPAGSRDAVRERAATVLGDRTWVTRMTERFDPTVYDAPEMRAVYQKNWDEASALSVEGYVDDWIVSLLPWGFELEDITVPVHVWYGERDVLVPIDDGLKIAGDVRHGTAHACPHCAHYVPVGHWPEILQQLT
jgi:pimeloyl-ACP methyl ester carboxylesterase